MGNTKIKTSTPFPFLFTLLSIIAFAASMELVLDKLRILENPNFKPSCDLNPFFSCSSVMQTPQANLFGFPNPILGIIGFAITLTIGMMLISRVGLNKLFAYGLLIGLAFAFGLVLYFWYLVIFVLHHFCLYCMIVWACVIPMFFLTINYLNETGFLGRESGFFGGLSRWTWPAIFLFYIIIYGGVWLAYLKLTAI
ncbi:MAG: vitamin K epoxide reductase family protein [Micrococcaceae bacterium]